MVYVGKINSRVTENTVYQENDYVACGIHAYRHICQKQGQNLKLLMQVQAEH